MGLSVFHLRVFLFNFPTTFLAFSFPTREILLFLSFPSFWEGFGLKKSLPLFGFSRVLMVPLLGPNRTKEYLCNKKPISTPVSPIHLPCVFDNGFYSFRHWQLRERNGH